MRIVGNAPSGGKKPTTPTIGTATDGGTGTTVSVAFTPSTYIGKGTITYTATSSPGSLTGTGSGSPITVSGLTTGTAYTFTVRGTTNYGVSSDNSAASNSVTPAAPTAFDSIATTTLSSSGTITFSSIPSTYKHLQIRSLTRHSASGNINGLIRLNGSSTSLITHYLTGDGSAASAAASSRTGVAFDVNGNAYASGIFTVSIIDIIDYASTTKNKTVRLFAGFDTNGAGQVTMNSGLYNSTSAVTSIDIVTDGSGFLAGSTFALYGIN